MLNFKPLGMLLFLHCREHYPIMDGERRCLLKAELCLS